jgi:hypothetical protein
MKKNIISLACCISIILIVMASGCVAPPKENATSTKTGTSAGGNKLIPGTTETPNYVTEVTPFVTVTASGTSGYSAIPTTPVPGDLYCRIYSTTNTYAYNKTAIAFNVQNPPMYINYTVKPSNITYKDWTIPKLTGEKEKQITIDTYSPYSWFVVTVMSKSTGEIYLQDGFGTQKYTMYLNRTLKVLNRDNMQIEFSGNNITATAMVWVKPEGNFDDPKFNQTTDCAYFAANPRNVISVVTAKTTATPTYRP